MSRFDLWLIILRYSLRVSVWLRMKKSRTDIISRPAPDEVRWQRTEDLGEYFTVLPRSAIPQFVCVRGERIGNEVVIVSPEFVFI